MLVLLLDGTPDRDVIITVPPSDTPTDIHVMLSETRGPKALLGFDAPREVAIDRVALRRRKEGGS